MINELGEKQHPSRFMGQKRTLMSNPARLVFKHCDLFDVTSESYQVSSVITSFSSYHSQPSHTARVLSKHVFTDESCYSIGY